MHTLTPAGATASLDLASLPTSTIDLVERAFALSSPGQENLGRPDTHEAFMIRGLGESGVSFLGNEAVRALREAVDALAQSALVHRGGHEKAVETILVEACVVARTSGAKAGVAHVESALSTRLKKWVVGARIYAHVSGQLDRDPFVVGRCFLSKHAAFWGSFADHQPLSSWFDDYKPAVLVTEVEAHDETSARWRASESFAEARAILLLASGSISYGALRPHFVLKGDGGLMISGGGDTDPTLIVRRVLDDGSLWPGYQQLSDAAARNVEDRTDWEARTLGAARWYQEALLGTWPAASLVAAMSAIEALLCFPGERRGKDRRIAERIVEYGARIQGVPDDEREAWFRSLYGRWRNNAIHFARFYEEERDIERLLGLSEAVVRWGISHLDPDHYDRGRSCATIAEAHGDHG